MKNLIYVGLFFTILGVGFVGCEKESVTETQNLKTENESGLVQKAAGPGIRIFTVEIHRPAGKTNKHGQQCECRICLGFCDFEWFPDFSYSGSEGNDATLATEALGDNVIRMYFFDAMDLDGADIDDLNNPLFHIDENILLEDGENTTIIFAGEYSLNLERGILETEEGRFEYNSYIDVKTKH